MTPPSHRVGLRPWTALAFALGTGTTPAQTQAAPEPAPAPAPGAVSFNESVRPILNAHCLACHGGVKQAGGVSFIYRDKALGEGDSGNRIIVPGNLEASEFIYRITTDDEDDRMPPVDESPHGLSEDEIATLESWVRQGAPWGKHWAFEPPVKPDPPEVEDEAWVRQPVDRFVLRQIEGRGWGPSPDAEPEEWLRRAALDVTGLPPAPEQLDLFLRDAHQHGEAAYERAADRLLASPAYGERWASVWLDQVRYADSRGLGQDGRRSIWKYRDWVIDAFNADLPYDEFTVKQLAGDLLPDPTMGDLIATAAHRNTQASNEGGTDDEEFRVEAVIDRVNTTWQTWQATAMGCAQCHSHPYDPIEQTEYYQFMAFFNNSVDCDTPGDEPNLRAPLDPADYAGARALDREVAAAEEEIWKAGDALRKDSQWAPLEIASVRSNNATKYRVDGSGGASEFVLVGGPENDTQITVEAALPDGAAPVTALMVTVKPRDPSKALADSEWGFVLSHLKVETVGDGARQLEFSHAWSDEPHPLRDPADSLEGSRWGFSAYTRINHAREAVFVLSEPLDAGDAAGLKITLDHKVTELGAFPLLSQRGGFAVSTSPAWTEGFARGDRMASLRRDLAAAREKRKAIKSVPVPVMAERPAPLARPTHLFARGNFLEKDARVGPGLPGEIAGPTGAGDRLAMAYWIASPDNPLTARVAVNRTWAQLFGRGIVATLEDFGSSGEKPTHPHLLDDLAVRFQGEGPDGMGWSHKRLLRELVLSSTYRQSAAVTPEHLERDPDNRWLARGPRVRLTAEMVRDQALAVSGLLSDKMHGPPVHPPIPDGVWRPFSRDDWKTPDPDSDDRFRRSVYTYTKRSIPYPTFATFDAPSREFCAPRRLTSNTPLQALTTLNDQAFVECTDAFAERIRAATPELDAQIAWGYRRATCRKASGTTVSTLRELYRETRRQLELEDAEGDTGHAAMRVVASVLLNLDEVMVR